MSADLNSIQVSPSVNTPQTEEFSSSDSSEKVSPPIGIASGKNTLTQASKKDCCDYIVPPEKQPHCWQTLTPCQKTTICCGGVIIAESGVIGGLIGTGIVSLSEGGGMVLIIIGVCCAVKIALGGLWCHAKFSSQEE